MRLRLPILAHPIPSLRARGPGLWRLFLRYSDARLRLTARGDRVCRADGSLVGQVERIALKEGRLTVAGWARAGQVAVSLGDARAVAVPETPRADVARALPGGSANVGFVLDLPSGSAPGTLRFDLGAEVVSLPFRPFAPRRVLLARLRLLPGFLWRLARLAPTLAAALRGDGSARRRVKHALGLDTARPAGVLDAGLFLPAGAAPRLPGDTGITIVLPVHNAMELLPDMLDRVLRNTDLPWRMILVEDCSTDPRVRPFLRAWAVAQNSAQPERVTLIENAKNLGFVGSVNRAFDLALDRGGPVVLLNSDAFVPPDWASRLVRPILAGRNVASVTPMSNDAEIFTAPAICAPAPLARGAVDRIDSTSRGFAPDHALVQAPTGVGFCMALNPDYLRRVPRFDSAFGRGYGEEVDWCQKTRALGGLHLCQHGLFVEHRGGSSFGSAEKARLVAEHNAIIARRYPEYDRDVQRFIAADPLCTPRLALAIAWAAAGGVPVPVLLAHSMGGGAEMVLQRRLERICAAQGAAIVLRVGGIRRWRIELHSAQGVTTGDTDCFDIVQRILAPVERRALVYSCGVGDPDPVELPARLLALYRPGRDTLEVAFHDYFPVSPSYCLLDHDGIYRGLPACDSRDPAHCARRADGTRVTLADWRRAWGALLSEADRIEVYSRSSRALVGAAWPELADRIALCPHTCGARPDPVSPVPGGALAVLGNIGLQKGAAVVSALSREAAARGQQLVVIGTVDPAFPLAPGTVVHGAYGPDEIGALARRYRIAAWLIPSIWPETFSFTTREALATGLPVIGFELGAQGEALAAAPNGIVLPPATVEVAADAILAAHDRRRAAEAA